MAKSELKWVRALTKDAACLGNRQGKAPVNSALIKYYFKINTGIFNGPRLLSYIITLLSSSFMVINTGYKRSYEPLDIRADKKFLANSIDSPSVFTLSRTSLSDCKAKMAIKSSIYCTLKGGTKK